MSSYSFSHQFYQHWTSAPQAVRAAIVQELTDITTLLQTDTPFEDFVFSNHDLDAHLDDLYSAHDKQQALEKELADKQAALRAEAEQQRLEEERLEQKKQQEKQRLQAEETATEEALVKEQTKNKQADNDKVNEQQIATEEKPVITEHSHNETDNLASASENVAIDEKAGAINSHLTAIGNKSPETSAIDLTLKDNELNAAHQQMIQELEAHIDDYLTEQMMQMSENLKSWLRAEVTRQLSEQSNDELNKK